MQQKTTPFTDAFDLFVLDMKACRLQAGTIEFYEYLLTYFRQWLDQSGLVDLEEISAKQIRLYLTDCTARGHSAHYVHGHARAIRTFLNFCVRDDLLDASPFDKVKMPQLPRKVLPALTPAEVRRVLGACKSDRNHAIVLFLVDSGVRASELCNLDVGDVDMKTGAVSVRQGKGQKDRTTYIGARTRKAVLRHLADRGDRSNPRRPLFLSEQHKTRLTYSAVAQIMRRLKKASGVDQLSAHALRRTFAITCLRNGMNVYVLARIMGHSDIQVLRQYLPLVDDDSQHAHEESGPVDNL